MNSEVSYRIIVSEKATQMLVAHAAYLAQVNENAANKFIMAFDNATTSLETFPHRNPWLNYTSLPYNKYRKLLFEKRYLLIYQIQDTTVYIDFVLDCRQDYDWLIR